MIIIWGQIAPHNITNIHCWETEKPTGSCSSPLCKGKVV